MKEQNKKNTENIGLVGIYKITKAKLTKPEHWQLNNKIKELMQMGKDVKELVNKLNQLCEVEVYEFKNIVPTVGRTLLANQLANSSPTNDPYVNYVALGTGSTAVANANTTLDTEVYRKATSSATNSNNVAYITGFFTADEDADTYYEAGLFCDGTASADSGVLLSRVLLNAPTGITKSVTETLTIDWTLTLS